MYNKLTLQLLCYSYLNGDLKRGQKNRDSFLEARHMSFVALWLRCLFEPVTLYIKKAELPALNLIWGRSLVRHLLNQFNYVVRLFGKGFRFNKSEKD